jgi:hypothetical protein
VTGPDTTDLRTGAPLSDAPLVGVWEGDGAGIVPSSGEQFAYRQRVTIAHDGRPFLVHDSRAWLITPDGAVIRPAFRESGFWRPGAGPDDVELVLADAAGLVEVFAGVAGHNEWELLTSSLAGTPSARAVVAERRFYAVADEALLYATELDTGGGLAPHLNARLARA